MGVQKTNLNDEKIKNILQNEYNIKATKIQKINRGTANIFKIETNQNKYILKEFTSTSKKETVIKEINIIEFLKDKDINVPTYIKTKKENFYLENEGRIIIVQEFVEGYTIENNTGDYEKTIECATILGKLTKALMEYPELSEDNIMNKYFTKERVCNCIEKMENLKSNLKKDNKYKEQIEKDINYRTKILNHIKNNFDFDILDKLTKLNSHGDFCSQQLIYNELQEPTIIDFEKAKKLPIVWEVIRSYSYIDKDAKDGDINIKTLADYFKEFSKYIKLNEYDLKYASYLYLLQLTGSTYGYKEYNEDYTQKGLLDFALFRTKLCKKLYEKAEEISLELTKQDIMN